MESLYLRGFLKIRESGFCLPLYALSKCSNTWYRAVSVIKDGIILIDRFEEIDVDGPVILAENKVTKARVNENWLSVLLWKKEIFVLNIHSHLSEEIEKEIEKESPIVFHSYCSLFRSFREEESFKNVQGYLSMKYGKDVSESWKSNALRYKEKTSQTEIFRVVYNRHYFNWYVSYAWGDKSPEGQERDRILADLMAEAQAQNIAIRQDRNEISFGESIRAFMEKLAAGQRIFILLSDKYLKSPFCTYELYHIWRQCRQDADEFSARVRLYQTPCAQIGDPGQRAAYYRHWKAEAARLSDIIAAYDPADVPKLDQDMLRAINGFKGQIATILAEISNRVQPRKWEDFIQHGFT